MEWFQEKGKELRENLYIFSRNSLNRQRQMWSSWRRVASIECSPLKMEEITSWWVDGKNPVEKKILRMQEIRRDMGGVT